MCSTDADVMARQFEYSANRKRLFEEQAKIERAERSREDRIAKLENHIAELEAELHDLRKSRNFK